MISISDGLLSEAMSAKAKASMEVGVAWLAKQQDANDGGWHSETYGTMRGGASITALVLYAASHLPKSYRQNEGWRRGLDFLLPGIRLRGFATCPDGTLDFPTYSTAMTLIATKWLEMEIPIELRKSMISYLISTQLTQANGFRADSIDFGGWDSIGGSGAVGVTSGTNLSVSMYAVEAIAGEEHRERTKVLERARQWCFGCQNWPNGDGGFFFQPEKISLANKAQWEDDSGTVPRSYGTATCDGLSLLLATGMELADERVQKALIWLTKSSQFDQVAGFSKAPPELGWKEGLLYYYFLGLSRTMQWLPHEYRVPNRERLLQVLIDRQSVEGFWENASASMREDDPLIATCFCLIAISNLLR